MRYKYGGEGGIRTLDTVLSVYPLSRRFPLFLMANDSSIHIKMTHLFLEVTGKNWCTEATRGEPKGTGRGYIFGDYLRLNLITRAFFLSDIFSTSMTSSRTDTASRTSGARLRRYLSVVSLRVWPRIC